MPGQRLKEPDEADTQGHTHTVLTDIARGPTGCGHHIPFTLHFGQSKITDHYFGFLILTVVQQVFGLGRKKQKRFTNYVYSWLIVANSPNRKNLPTTQEYTRPLDKANTLRKAVFNKAS